MLVLANIMVSGSLELTCGGWGSDCLFKIRRVANMNKLLDLNKNITPIHLLAVVSPERIATLANEAEAVSYNCGSRAATRRVIENAIRQALIEATVSLGEM